MQIYKELSLDEFEPWLGAVEKFDIIRENNKMQELEDLLQTVFFNQIITTTMVNDLLWFESDFIFEHLEIEQE